MARPVRLQVFRKVDGGDLPQCLYATEDQPEGATPEDVTMRVRAILGGEAEYELVDPDDGTTRMLHRGDTFVAVETVAHSILALDGEVLDGYRYRRCLTVAQVIAGRSN